MSGDSYIENDGLVGAPCPSDEYSASKKIKKGQKLYVTASNRSGKQPFLSILPERIFRSLERKDLEHGASTNVICEVVFDGHTLTITQGLESIVLQK